MHASGNAGKGKKHWYRIWAVTASGNGEAVVTTSVASIAAGTPSTPLGLHVSSGSSKIHVSWNVPQYNGGSSITGYQVQYVKDESNTIPTTGWAAVPSTNTDSTCDTASSSTGRACLQAGLEANKRYWYKVAAVNALGQSVFSSPQSGIVLSNAQTFSKISAGSSHTCAVTKGGGVKCWGYNGYGQLGDGTNTNSSTPVDVTGLTSGLSAVSAGDNHTCALTTSGGVKCWGYGDYGRLGNGTTARFRAPVDVTGLTSGVSAISTGGSHTCALTTSGGVKCWGYNGNGELWERYKHTLQYTCGCDRVNIRSFFYKLWKLSHMCAYNRWWS